MFWKKNKKSNGSGYAYIWRMKTKAKSNVKGEIKKAVDLPVSTILGLEGILVEHRMSLKQFMEKILIDYEKHNRKSKTT